MNAMNAMILANHFDTFVFSYLSIVLVSYSFAILIFALAKSPPSRLEYVLFGAIICCVPIFFSLAIRHALFIYCSLLPMPVRAQSTDNSE